MRAYVCVCGFYWCVCGLCVIFIGVCVSEEGCVSVCVTADDPVCGEGTKGPYAAGPPPPRHLQCISCGNRGGGRHAGARGCFHCVVPSSHLSIHVQHLYSVLLRLLGQVEEDTLQGASATVGATADSGVGADQTAGMLLYPLHVVFVIGSLSAAATAASLSAEDGGSQDGGEEDDDLSLDQMGDAGSVGDAEENLSLSKPHLVSFALMHHMARLLPSV